MISESSGVKGHNRKRAFGLTRYYKMQALASLLVLSDGHMDYLPLSRVSARGHASVELV